MNPVEYLKSHGIGYILHEHKAVSTVEEAAEHAGHIPGMHCKNLFLKDSKNGQFFLVCMPARKVMDLKRFKMMIGAKKIRFGNEEELMEILGLTKGSVSPFGLINDDNGRVHVYLDKDLWVADIVSFHPNRNDQTLELKKEEFRAFFSKVAHVPEIIDL